MDGRRLTFIGGTSGAGKSTLVSAMRSEPDILIVSTGDIMKSVVNEYFGIGLDRDAVKYANWQLFEPYVISQLAGVVSYQRQGHLALDSHYAVHLGGAFAPAFTDGSIHYLGKRLCAKEYERADCILIEAPVDEIIRRIEVDPLRKRGENMTRQFIESESAANRACLRSCADILSQYIKTEMTVLTNDDLATATDALVNLLR